MQVNIIDVSGYIYRAFYAIPRLIYENKEVGALYGFCAAMKRITAKFQNSMFIAALDCGKKTFRNELYPAYKANRKNMPAELVSQVDLIKEACCHFGFFAAEFPGFEADDVIASYVKALESKDFEITVISSDKDLMQLLSCNNVKIFDPMKQKYITENDVMKKFGVSPDKILDVLALMGDSSDNIPGVSGIGPKTAATLINQFGSLENLIENVDSLPQNKKNMTLKNEINNAILSKKLAKLRSDLPVSFEYLESTPTDLSPFLAKFGFKSLHA